MPKSSSLIYYVIFLLVAFIYPAFESIRAVETPDKSDDTIWLTYWVVFAAFNIVELAADGLLFWLPLYQITKMAFLLWCSAPLPNNGAYYIYKAFLRPLYAAYSKDIDCALTSVLHHIYSPGSPNVNEVQVD